MVSNKVLENSSTIQDIYTTWNPIFKNINIKARGSESKCSSPGTACFFSGGVDGTYTLLEHADEVDYAILINGFDFNMDDSTWRSLINRNLTLTKELGIELIAVETNFKYFTSAFGIARKCNFGGVLISAGQLLGFRKLFIAAAVTYKKIPPDGSHVLIDESWSTEGTQVIHSGLEADRTKKIKRISSHKVALDNLWVCWKDPRYNCGDCVKCIRTYIALRLAGVDNFNFENPLTLADCGRFSIDNEFEYIIYEAYLDSAQTNKEGDKELERFLMSAVMKYQFRIFMKSVINRFAPSLLNWRQSKRPDTDKLVDISIHPRYSDTVVLRDVKKRFESGKQFKEQENIGTVY